MIKAQTPPTKAATPDQVGAGSGDASPDDPGGRAGGAERDDVPTVVGIGASAGGIEALRLLFAHLPDDTGLAFVVLQHLDPDRPSMLASVLAGEAHMPVTEVVDRMRPQPNRIVVIPPQSDISIRDGILVLSPRPQPRVLHHPVDSFLRSLADDQPGRAIGVVLSGSGTDGTEGLRGIKAAGGITIAQDPASAQFASMPESALAAGVADLCLSPADIARELARLGRDPYLVSSADDEGRPDEQALLTSALAAVRRHAQIDFTGYKRPTIKRRIGRRMALRQLRAMSDYVTMLQADPSEARELARDVLIHVTSFFRDPDAFEALERQVFPELLAHKTDDAPIRIWVPGCSTGQEAYSLIIALLAFLDRQGDHDRVIKLFGSDLSEAAIDKARAGQYREAEVDGVSPERLARFFERVDGHYRISKRVRDCCVFVRHDLTRDPPFARLDLVSCRNVLIYFDTELQRRVVPMLHHSLNTPGYLFLGSSESIGAFGELFAAVDKEHRIFAKTGESPSIGYPPAFGREAEARIPLSLPTERRQPMREAQRQADHLLLSRYSPAGVVVNERMDIVQFRGRTGAFLESPPGQPQMNVLRMAREDLVVHLREAFEAAKNQMVAVRKEGVRVVEDALTRVVNLEVVPLAAVGETSERYFVVIFEEAAPPAPTPAAPPTPAGQHADEEMQRLKAELVATRDYLQALVSDHQVTTDDLSTTNEELIASNEELQATNEELESAKEELQATNEELSTVNDELRNRNDQLDRIANDLANVLASVEIPVIIVDQALRVRRFTPMAQVVSSLLPGDVGRPIDDVKLKIKVDDLVARIRETIETITPREWEVQALDDRWFRLQVRPYRTADNRLDGAILSFVDVDVLKRAVQEAERARDYARSIVEVVPSALIVLGEDRRIVSANHAFCESVAVDPDAVVGVGLFDLAAGALNVPALRDAIAGSLAARSRFRSLEIQCDFPRIGRKMLCVGGSPIQWGDGQAILLAIDDVTERHALEASVNRARLEAEQANHAKDLFLATLSHELRTPLNVLLMSSQILRQVATDDPRLQRVSAAIDRSVGNQARLIDDLLDVSRIVSGKLLLDLQPVDLASVVYGAVDAARPSAEAKGLGLDVTIRDSLGPVHGDPARLQQIVANLLNNAIKFTPRGGEIAVSVEALDGHAQITVADTGVGISPEILPHVFSRFVQGESSTTRAYGGLGLGLAIVRHLVEVHGGEVHAESPGPGRGATFRVVLPVSAHGAAPAASAPRSVARSIAGVRVLLVEDDDDSREAFATLLGALGAEVRAVATAAEGLTAVASFRPHVILCDIAMPGEDGYAFIRKLRSLAPDKGGQIPAAAITALAGAEDRQRVLSAGFQVHLAKPIEPAHLAEAVGDLASWTPPVSSTT